MNNKTEKSPVDKVPDEQEINVPDDSLKSVDHNSNEEPEIYRTAVIGRNMDRINFLKIGAGFAGLTALGTILSACEESELEITEDGQRCTCHAVCSCDSECSCDSDNDSGGSSTYYITYWYPN